MTNPGLGLIVLVHQRHSIVKQITLVSNLLSTIAKQGKIINCVLGNHEERSNKEVGINPMDMIVANLCKYDEKTDCCRICGIYGGMCTGH